MTVARFSRALLAGLFLVPAALLAQTSTPAPPAEHDHHAMVDSRGDHVMGFDHEKTTHHFRLYKNGGAIEITANQAEDTASRDAIRGHLSHIAKMFANIHCPQGSRDGGIRLALGLGFVEPRSIAAPAPCRSLTPSTASGRRGSQRRSRRGPSSNGGGSTGGPILSRALAPPPLEQAGIHPLDPPRRHLMRTPGPHALERVSIRTHTY